MLSGFWWTTPLTFVHFTQIKMTEKSTVNGFRLTSGHCVIIILRFMNNLPGHVLRYQCKHQRSRAGAFNLMANIRIIICEFPA